jgi:uncharacterized membrane protein
VLKQHGHRLDLGAVPSDSTISTLEELLKATRKRTLVKTLIYRCWVILSTYVMLLITGQDYTTAIIPAIVINLVWTTSYYLYDRLWLRIKWGLED